VKNRGINIDVASWLAIVLYDLINGRTIAESITLLNLRGKFVNLSYPVPVVMRLRPLFSVIYVKVWSVSNVKYASYVLKLPFDILFSACIMISLSVNCYPYPSLDTYLSMVLRYSTQSTSV
jgi:hypothetical protein